MLGREPRRLPVHVRRRAAVAQEPARQRRRRRRSRSPTASTPTATSRTTSSTTRRAPRRSRRARPIAAPAGVRARDAGAEGPARPDRLLVPGQLPLRRRVAAVRRGLAGRHADRRRPDLLALSGNLDEPAIAGLPPGTELRRPLRHQRRDHGLRARVTGALAWTPELGEGCRRAAASCSRTTRRRCRRSSSATCRSRSRSPSRPSDPDDPKSSLGIETKPFYIESDDPYKDGIPGANFAFEYSYGDPQPVAGAGQAQPRPVDAEVPHQRRPRAQRADPEWKGGERYDAADVLLPRDARRRARHRPGRLRRGLVRGRQGAAHRSSRSPIGGLRIGNAGCWSSRPRTTRAPRRCRRPARTTSTTTSTRSQANGIEADVYDVDARGRTAPDHLGVLSHYDAVIWYTGDDIVTRTRRLGRGNADRLAMDEILEFRAYMNEGGRVLYTGKWAGQQYSGAGAVGNPALRPEGRGPCNPPTRRSTRGAASCCAGLRRRPRQRRARVLVRRATSRSPTTASTDDGDLFDVNGIDDPFTGLAGASTAPDSADNQDTSSSFVADERHPAAGRVPAVRSWPSTRWDKPGGPFEPHTGDAVRLLADRRRVLQAADAEIAVPGRRRQADVLDLVRHRGGLGLPVRRGPHAGRRRLDDAA